ncbi:MAG: ribosome small subunit-dependent GTPase A [Steroidobacteraceae bacterium]
MSTRIYSLDQLGWSPVYSQQLTLEDLAAGFPARVSGVHRSSIVVLSERAPSLTLPRERGRESSSITVGDWLLVEHEAPRVLRVLERRSLIARMAAGIEQHSQPIAANVDTLFVVTSCNQDFNLSRLERYLALARHAQVEPVIVITKADLCVEAESFVSQARSVAGRAEALALDATSREAASWLGPWLAGGQTVAFVGSSGVGKSTLVNTLLGGEALATGAIREDDDRGRHTTTSRQMLALPGGPWVIDTPGMRELKIGAVESGVSAVFAEVEELVHACRFRDCNHEQAAGCALEAAVAAGQLDARRLSSYLKLQREAKRAGLSLHERRESERRFGRMVRSALKTRYRLKGRDH